MPLARPAVVTVAIIYFFLFSKSKYNSSILEEALLVNNPGIIE
ncbi:hypothetical protein OAJ82_02715 [Alphaproteobacteria bacterium]|nr:hypothetical protein [Alphaproteobacteria bacterium]